MATTKRIDLGWDSRYHRTPRQQVVHPVTGAPTTSFCFGVWEPIRFEPDDQDLLHMVREADLGRIDLIAHRYYGNVNLWWVIASENLIRDPLSDLFVGQLLRIPARNTVTRVLMAAEREQRDEVELL